MGADTAGQLMYGSMKDEDICLFPLCADVLDSQQRRLISRAGTVSQSTVATRTIQKSQTKSRGSLPSSLSHSTSRPSSSARHSNRPDRCSKRRGAHGQPSLQAKTSQADLCSPATPTVTQLRAMQLQSAQQEALYTSWAKASWDL